MLHFDMCGGRPTDIWTID